MAFFICGTEVRRGLTPAFLGFVKLAISAAAAHQLFVRAPLGNVPLTKHDDLVQAEY
jgi:hypothetical protein